MKNIYTSTKIKHSVTEKELTLKNELKNNVTGFVSKNPMYLI